MGLPSPHWALVLISPLCLGHAQVMLNNIQPITHLGAWVFLLALQEIIPGYFSSVLLSRVQDETQHSAKG